MQRIFHRRFQRLVMRRQWAVFQSARNVEPSFAIGVHDERLVAGQSVVAASGALRFVIRRLGFGEIGRIEADPFFGGFIPPNQFLALAPGLAVGARRSAVIEDAAIGGPGESPTVTIWPAWLALVSFVFAGPRHNPGIDPAAAGGRAVGF